jgi:uncharacterized FlgJ-related protein
MREIGLWILYLHLYLLPINTLAAINLEERRYIDKYRVLANTKASDYGIPAEVILAVAIVESGAGATKVARELNNHFGMIGKNHVKWKTRYRQYRTTEESYDHFCRYIADKSFYEKLRKGAKDSVWIAEISHLGYSEKPRIWERRLNVMLKKINTVSSNYLSD